MEERKAMEADCGMKAGRRKTKVKRNRKCLRLTYVARREGVGAVL